MVESSNVCLRLNQLHKYGNYTDDDCIHDFVWEDDGEYMVRLTITDGESDTDTIEQTFTILNRPPEIIVEASAYSIQFFPL